MTTSHLTIELPAATGVEVTDDALIAVLADGRTISTPLGWFPRLVHGTEEERANWRLSSDGEHIHWPDLDEDISIEGLVAGRPSGESDESFRRWLEAKRAGTPLDLPSLFPEGGE